MKIERSQRVLILTDAQKKRLRELAADDVPDETSAPTKAGNGK